MANDILDYLNNLNGPGSAGGSILWGQANMEAGNPNSPSGGAAAYVPSVNPAWAGAQALQASLQNSRNFVDQTYANDYGWQQQQQQFKLGQQAAQNDYLRSLGQIAATGQQQQNLFGLQAGLSNQRFNQLFPYLQGMLPQGNQNSFASILAGLKGGLGGSAPTYSGGSPLLAALGG